MIKIAVLHNKKLEIVELNDLKDIPYIEVRTAHRFNVTCLNKKGISWFGVETPYDFKPEDVNAIIWDSRLTPKGRNKINELVTGASVFILMILRIHLSSISR